MNNNVELVEELTSIISKQNDIINLLYSLLQQYISLDELEKIIDN